MHKPLYTSRTAGIGALLALVCSFLSIFASPAGAQSRCAGDPLVEFNNRFVSSGRGLGGVLDAEPVTGDLSDPAAAGTYTVRTLSADSTPGRASAVAETDESWTAVFVDASGNEVGRTPFTRDLADGVASAESADTFTVRLSGEATSVRVDHKILDVNAPANTVMPICVGLTASGSASGSADSGATGSGSAGDAATPAKAPCATNPNIPFDSTSCGAAGSGAGTDGSAAAGDAGGAAGSAGDAAAPAKAPCATNPAIPFDSTSCGAAGSGAGADGSGAAGGSSGAAGSGAAGSGAATGTDSTGGKPACLTNPAIPADSTSCNPNGPKAPCATNPAIPFDSTSCADANVLGETVAVDAGDAGGAGDAAGAGGAAGDAAGAGGAAGDAAAGGAAGDAAGAGAADDTAGAPVVDGTLAITGAGTVVALTLVFGCLLVAGGIAAMNAASRRQIFG